jgi:hypothetical protein
MEDGGYYAIKGFDFQIDKTILALFDTKIPTDSVAIEQIQDLNTDAFVLQVKFKETQDFSNAKIREPVVKLIQDFMVDTLNRNYILYCYFKDKPASSLTFNSSGIDQILEISLGKSPSKAHQAKYDDIQNIPPSIRTGFSKKFTLQFAESYDSQFSKVMELLSAQNFCRSKQEAIFFYAYIVDYLRKIVTNNTDPAKRICNRKALVSSIENNKRALFYSCYAEYETREKFLKFVKARAPVLWVNQNNCLVFGDNLTVNDVTNLIEIVDNFLNSYYVKAVCDINPPTVLVREDLCKNLKIGLLQRKWIVNDGYEELCFQPDFLTSHPVAIRKLVNKKTTESLGAISFEVRVASIERLPAIVMSGYIPDRVLYLGANEVDEWTSSPTFLIDTAHVDEVPQFIKVGR